MDEKRLSLGPIGAAQELIGKSHQSWDETEQHLALAIAFNYNRERAQHYDARCDTHYNAPFSLSQEILAEYGFKKVWTAQGIDKRSQDHLEVWVHDSDILVLLESYNITGHLNQGSVFACVPWASVEGLPIGSRHPYPKEDAYMMNWDAREGLQYLLERLVPRVKYSFPWLRQPFGFTLTLPGEQIHPVRLKEQARQTRLPEICKAAGVTHFWKETD